MLEVTQLTSIGIRLLFLDKMEYERNLTFLRTQIDEKAFAKYWSKGRGMTLEEGIAFALNAPGH